MREILIPVFLRLKKQVLRIPIPKSASVVGHMVDIME